MLSVSQSAAPVAAVTVSAQAGPLYKLIPPPCGVFEFVGFSSGVGDGGLEF